MSTGASWHPDFRRGKGIGDLEDRFPTLPGGFPTLCTPNKRQLAPRQGYREGYSGISVSAHPFFINPDLSSNNLQVFCSQTRSGGSCQSEGRLGEHGLVLAYILSQDLALNSSQASSLATTPGERKGKKKREREGTLTGLRLLGKLSAVRAA